MLNILSLDKDSDKKKYILALASLKNSHPYYTLEFLEAFSSERGNLKAFLFNLDNKLQVLMPFYMRAINHKLDLDYFYFDVISPYGFNGPIKNDQPNNIFKAFWQAVDQWYTNNNIISEFIRFDLNNNHMFYSGSLVNTLQIVNGAIIDFDSIWTNYESKVRKNVKKAQKHELTASVFTDKIPLNVIEAFYNIYITTMKRKAASKVYFYSKEMLTNFIQNNIKHRAIALVYKDETPISTELLLLSNSRIYSFLGGTLSEYFDLRPNDFLKNEVIKWACSRDFKNYVLGGGQKNGDGIFKYKKAFFKNNFSSFYTGRKIINQQVYEELSKDLLNENEGREIDFFPLYRLPKHS